MHMPAATVVPMSLMANLPSWGISFTGSMTMGLEGVTMMMAASQALMKAGFSSLTAPDLGSSLARMAVRVQAT